MRSLENGNRDEATGGRRHRLRWRAALYAVTERVIGRLDAFDNGTHALSKANAHRGKTELRVPLLKHVGNCARDASARATEWVTEGDGSPLHVDSVGAFGQLHFLNDCERLCCKGLIKLDVVDVI